MAVEMGGDGRRWAEMGGVTLEMGGGVTLQRYIANE
jgi:hypothetical protein